jgi:hypothetical protein
MRSGRISGSIQAVFRRGRNFGEAQGPKSAQPEVSVTKVKRAQAKVPVLPVSGKMWRYGEASHYCVGYPAGVGSSRVRVGPGNGR